MNTKFQTLSPEEIKPDYNYLRNIRLYWFLNKMGGEGLLRICYSSQGELWVCLDNLVYGKYGTYPNHDMDKAMAHYEQLVQENPRQSDEQVLLNKRYL